jgi:hypothetical protein
VRKDVPLRLCFSVRAGFFHGLVNWTVETQKNLGLEEGHAKRSSQTLEPDGKWRNPTSLEHLAVKDLVLFLTGRAGSTDTTGHEQRRTYRDEYCRPVRLKLKKPANEGV